MARRLQKITFCSLGCRYLATGGFCLDSFSGKCCDHFLNIKLFNVLLQTLVDFCARADVYVPVCIVGKSLLYALKLIAHMRERPLVSCHNVIRENLERGEEPVHVVHEVPDTGYGDTLSINDVLFDLFKAGAYLLEFPDDHAGCVLLRRIRVHCTSPAVFRRTQ